MQLKKEDYNKTKHVRYKALSVHQPYANLIAKGEKIYEVRSRNINYRGDVIICSTKTPVISDDYLNSAILCIVELYDVVKFSDLTDEEKSKTKIEKSSWWKYKTFFVWKLRNVRRVIEKPVIGGQGVFNLYCEKDYVLEYPLELGKRKPTAAEKVKEFGEQAKKIKKRAVRGIVIIILIMCLLVMAIMAGVKIISYICV